MNRAQQQTKAVQQLINAGKAECFWQGDSLPAIKKIISALDLELPAEGRYLFVKDGNSLTISEELKGITRYKINNSAAEVEIDNLAITIMPGSSRSIVLVRKPKRIPASAKSFTHLDGPVDLLEEYAELFAKQKAGTITDKERERQGKLVALIGQGYQKLRNDSEIPAYRSTPPSTGESRSSSAYTCGG